MQTQTTQIEAGAFIAFINGPSVFQVLKIHEQDDHSLVADLKAVDDLGRCVHGHFGPGRSVILKEWVEVVER